MTPEQLKEIRERAEKATPGEWHVEDPSFDGWTVWREGMCLTRCGHAEFDRLNADFIAHAPTDIAALRKDNERLRAVLKIAVEALKGIDIWLEGEGGDFEYDAYCMAHDALKAIRDTEGKAGE